MKEEVLQYAWANQLIPQTTFYTSEGEEVTILDFGKVNSDFGPDIQKAKIYFRKEILTGPIEIHINGQDWEAHQHSQNVDYHNIILHVCLFNGKTIWIEETEIPTINIQENCSISLELLEHYFTFAKPENCSNTFLQAVPTEIIQAECKSNLISYYWKEGLRLHQKWKTGVSIPTIRFQEFISLIGIGPNRIRWQEWANQINYEQLVYRDLDKEQLIQAIQLSIQGKENSYQIPPIYLVKNRSRGGRAICKIIGSISSLFQEDFFQYLNSEKLEDATIPIISPYFKFHILYNLIPKDIARSMVFEGDINHFTKIETHLTQLPKEAIQSFKFKYPFHHVLNGFDGKLKLYYQKRYCNKRNCPDCGIFKYWVKSQS